MTPVHVQGICLHISGLWLSSAYAHLCIECTDTDSHLLAPPRRPSTSPLPLLPLPLPLPLPFPRPFPIPGVENAAA